MKIDQLSLFLENRPGHIGTVCQALADAGINILTLSMADTQQFGILRLIVDDPSKARQVLEQAGCVVKLTEVVATEVEDKPGGLAGLLKMLEAGNVNIEYMYAFTFGSQGRAVMVFRFDRPDTAIEVLQSHGVNVLRRVDLYDRAKR